MDMESFEGWILPARRYGDLFGAGVRLGETDGVLLSADDVPRELARRLGRPRTLWLTGSLLPDLPSDAEEELEPGDGSTEGEESDELEEDEDEESD